MPGTNRENSREEPWKFLIFHENLEILASIQLYNNWGVFCLLIVYGLGWGDSFGFWVVGRGILRVGNWMSETSELPRTKSCILTLPSHTSTCCLSWRAVVQWFASDFTQLLLGKW
ncbi:unnamed protein product [Ectocarpus sp. 12 AP-2014]